MGGTGDNKKQSSADIDRENEDFTRRLLATLHAAIQERSRKGVFGELTFKVTHNKGQITGAKVVEETIIRPGDT